VKGKDKSFEQTGGPVEKDLKGLGRRVGVGGDDKKKKKGVMGDGGRTLKMAAAREGGMKTAR